MKDKFSNWLLGICGRSHIGIYKCSACGYELLRSDFSKSFVFKSPNLQGLLPLPVTVAAAKAKGSGKDKDDNTGGKDQKKVPISITPFNDTMIEDFAKNFNLGKTYHKQSFVKSLIKLEGNCQDVALPMATNKGTNYELSCGKCGNSLGNLLVNAEKSSFSIKKNAVDLIFQTT